MIVILACMAIHNIHRLHACFHVCMCSRQLKRVAMSSSSGGPDPFGPTLPLADPSLFRPPKRNKIAAKYVENARVVREQQAMLREDGLSNLQRDREWRLETQGKTYDAHVDAFWAQLLD